MPFDDQRKIAVVGVGAVGASSAYAMMISGLIDELVLVDINRERAEGEAMDLAHGASFIKPIKIYVGEYEDCRDADLIIFSAGVPQKPGETRLDLVFKNLEVLKQALPRCIDRNSDTILLMVTNPVDVLTYAALRLTDLPPDRVIGSGTVLDSSRFRYLISEHCRVEARNIHAYVVGEHGDTEVPLWSLANIAGFSVQDFCCQRGVPCLDQEAITRRVREAAYEVIARKGATYYAVGLAVKRICESILRDENSILTVSGLIDGEYGISDVCLSLPSIVNRRGRVRILPVPMSAEEEEALRHSAAALKEIQQRLDLTPLPRKEHRDFLPPGYEYREFTGYH
ncbi:MAG: L-lactate dehydrogenase [Armatimonadetes bacterium]|nr:L-lactate dehydrogenase [Armatimonadota bacterium]